MATSVDVRCLTAMAYMLYRHGMKPVRIQLSRRKGFKLQPNSINVARPTPWGNPFIRGNPSGIFDLGDKLEVMVLTLTLNQCIFFYEQMILGNYAPEMHPIAHDWDKKFKKKMGEHSWRAVRGLEGYNLACWCKLSEPCHADVLLKLANK